MIGALGAGARPAQSPPATPSRRLNKAQPKAALVEPTIEVSASDLERPPAYGMDEFIRIPKTGSILPWLALLLAGGVAIALWHDDARRTSLLATLHAWRTSLVGPAAWNAVGPAVSAGPNASAKMGMPARRPRRGSA